MTGVRFHLPTDVIVEPGIFRKLRGLLPVKGGRTAVITDKGIEETDGAKELFSLLEKEYPLSIYNRVVPNPDEDSASQAAEFLRKSGVKQVIALGGGSSLDTAKIAAALAVNDKPLSAYQWDGEEFENPPLPLYALPTTSGTGSEVTGVSVITSRGTKKGVLGPAMYPRAALVDAELTVSLPPRLTAHTGMDALAHAVEAYLGRSASAVTDAFAEQAIRLTGKYLLRVFENSGDVEGRHGMALASTMAGIAFDQSGLGFIHAMASPVCADLHVPHGLAMALLLPYGLEFNRKEREKRVAEIGVLLGAVESSGASGAAEQTVRFITDLRSTLKLDSEFDKIGKLFGEHKKNTGTDEADFGRRAAEGHLMKNNPIHPEPEECAAVFTKMFTERTV